MDPSSLNLISPFTAVVNGPTSCGKSTFVSNLLINRNLLIRPAPDRIVYCYGEYQPGFDVLKKQIPTIEFHQGLIDVTEFNSKINNFLVLDDLMTEAGASLDIANLFTRGSHHRNLTVLLLTQNLFAQGKHMRTISLNAHYLILFKSPRDMSQISYLASQMYPGRTSFLRSAFNQATEKPHSYLLIDLKQNTPEELRLRARILPSEYPTIIYK